MPNATRTPVRRGERGPYANGEKRRAEIVDAAMAVFAEHGYRRISLRQIAEQLGTSHVTLLHHFGSKDALLEAVLTEREERDRPVREEILGRHGLLEGVAEVMRRNTTIRGLIQLDATLSAEAIEADHPAHEFIRRREIAFVDGVLAQLELERARGAVRADLSLPVVARQVVALIEGIQVQWLYDESVDMAAHVAAFMDLLRPGPAA